METSFAISEMAVSIRRASYYKFAWNSNFDVSYRNGSSVLNSVRLAANSEAASLEIPYIYAFPFTHWILKFHHGRLLIVHIKFVIVPLKIIFKKKIITWSPIANWSPQPAGQCRGDRDRVGLLTINDWKVEFNYLTVWFCLVGYFL